jgi:beta-phosphoglucomutase
MVKNSKIKAILFDLDGVLVNMPEGHYEALNRALGYFGAKIEKTEHLNYFNGLPTRKKLEELEKQGRLPTGLREFINEIKQKYTKEIIPKYCVPDYLKIILLKHLKEKGFKLACCSNSIKETLHLMLKSAQILNFFDLIVGNDEISIPKPNPEIYFKTFEALNLKPEECIILEDSKYGIAAAKASGANVFEIKRYEDVDLLLFKDLLEMQ